MFLTGKTVAMVSSDVINMTTTCSAIFENLFVIIVAGTEKDL